MYVCPSIFLTTVDPTDYTLVGCVAEDPKKCTGECRAVWMNGSRQVCKQQHRKKSGLFRKGTFLKGNRLYPRNHRKGIDTVTLNSAS